MSLKTFNTKINLIGAGQMGSAMIKGWLEAGLSTSLLGLRDPHISDSMRGFLNEHHIDADLLHDDPDLMILAVKPQVSSTVMQEAKVYSTEKTVIISIMAGVTVAKMTSIFGKTQPIIRTIPNTPSSVGRGITAAFANKYVSEPSKKQAEILLSALGPVLWVNSEELIDAATAVSGSGPAYVFLMAESLAKAGIEAGLPPEIAVKLARATVEGAGELLYKSPQVESSRLRENVTSPKGTTYAALQVLMGENGLDALMTKAVKAAYERSLELGK